MMVKGGELPEGLDVLMNNQNRGDRKGPDLLLPDANENRDDAAPKNDPKVPDVQNPDGAGKPKEIPDGDAKPKEDDDDTMSRLSSCLGTESLIASGCVYTILEQFFRPTTRVSDSGETRRANITDTLVEIADHLKTIVSIMQGVNESQQDANESSPVQDYKTNPQNGF
jgi:hypothetical protein